MSESQRLKTAIRSKIEDVGDRLAEQAGQLGIGVKSFGTRDTVVIDSGRKYRMIVRVDVERVE